MERRKALKGILGITTLGVAMFQGADFIFGFTSSDHQEINKHSDLIAELVDVIIPPTDTPGAQEAQVHCYIIGYMEQCASHKEFRNFINGLNDIEENSKIRFRKKFNQCNSEQKLQVLMALDDSSKNGLLRKINDKISGRSFFNLLKTLTVEGYCTSEVGATQHLSYEAVPGRYNAITKMAYNQKAWATK